MTPVPSRKKLAYLYGKWTERLRTCDVAQYEETLERIKREGKSPQNSPGHKKILTRLSSLKVGSFKPSHQDTIDDPETEAAEALTVDDIPESTVLWEATPRPPNSADVSAPFTFLL